MLPILSEQRFWHVLTFGAVLLVYAGVHLLNGNSLVAVLVFGLTLANFPAIRKQVAGSEARGSPGWYEVPQGGDSSETGEKQPHLEMHTFHAECWMYFALGLTER